MAVRRVLPVVRRSPVSYTGTLPNVDRRVSLVLDERCPVAKLLRFTLLELRLPSELRLLDGEILVEDDRWRLYVEPERTPGELMLRRLDGLVTRGRLPE